jgi:RHS repeat-associated protein
MFTPRYQYLSTFAPHLIEDFGTYIFAFNEQEKDDEIKGNGNSINYLARIYDPRLGRFLSIDPLTKEYPWYTPYQFAGNKPIAFIDRDGEEEARPEEIAYALLNPLDALQVDANRQKAVTAAQNSGLPNARDGQQDAFRHAFWNALNSRDIGAGNAEPFATIHETGMTNPANDPSNPSYDPIAIQMDLFNNAIGRKIGALNPNATDEELAALVMQALANGELKVVTNIGAANTSKTLGVSTHPTLSPGDKVAPDYEVTYDEYNGTEDGKREKRLETLPNSGTGAGHKDNYSGQQMDRKAKNAQNEY